MRLLISQLETCPQTFEADLVQGFARRGKYVGPVPQLGQEQARFAEQCFLTVGY